MLASTATYNDVWQNCLSELKMRTTEQEFAQWFQPLEPLDYDGVRLCVKVPDRNFAKAIEANYSQVLKPVIAQLFGRDTRLCYAIPKSPDRKSTRLNSSHTCRSRMPSSA